MRRRSLFLILLFETAAASGATLNVYPLKIVLSRRDRSSSVSLTNVGNEQATVQVTVRKWRQDIQGTDAFSDTDDIVFFPKIVIIPAGQKQIIRVGMRTIGEDPPVESAYRLFIDELPLSQKVIGVRMTMRLGIPLFIGPTRTTKSGAIDSVSVRNDQMTIVVRNSGNSHAHISSMTIIALDAKRGQVFRTDRRELYVLGASLRAFMVKVPTGLCNATATVRVWVDLGGLQLYKESPRDAACAVRPAS